VAAGSRSRCEAGRRGALASHVILAPVEPGSVVAGRFEIERLAGKGGMGAVYRARDRTDGGAVALKVTTGTGAQSGERFAREARVLAELRHPGIVRYVGHGLHGQAQWLAMEWLEGEDLAARLARGALPLREALELCARVAEAVGAAHARGVVHRDLKPSNLFLPGGEVGRAKVLDFGIARRGAQVSLSMTRTGALLGTPGYMAPEQARGARALDARVDVFALGCVLYECATGRAAFSGDHPVAVLAKILLEEAPRPSALRRGLPPALDELVARMLAKEPAGRPADGGAVAAEIAALLASGTIVPETGGAATDVDFAEPPERADALTLGEQRVMSIVLVAPGDETIRSDALAATLDATSGPAAHPGEPPGAGAGAGAAGGPERVRDALDAIGAVLELLADGSLLARLAGSGSATDHAAAAARAALVLRGLLPGRAIAIATGRGVVAERVPLGEVLDRAARLLARAAPVILLDDLTAALLDRRFDVRRDGEVLSLCAEAESPDVARTLLGRRTPFVGREAELAALEASFAACAADGTARVVLITGAPGGGKSRLRHELLERLRAGDAALVVWSARGDAFAPGSPFAMAGQLVRRAAGVLEAEAPEARRAKIGARVAEVLSDPAGCARVTEFLGEIAGAPFPDEDSPALRAARLDALVMSDQRGRAWQEWLAAECARRPVLIVLEDVHRGDLSSVRLVDAALHALAERPLMVVATARPEVHDRFPGLWQERAFQELRLGALSRKASERLVRRVLGDELPAEAVGRMVERAAGNAFYLEELIRVAADGGGDALPETVLAMAQARLEALPAGARRVLRAASVFGMTFWRGGVRALLGGAAERGTGEWLDELVDREVIARRGAGRFVGEEEYGFRHALLLEAARAALTDSDQTLGHRLAAEWLERAGEEDAIVLAEHFERGAAPQSAAAWWARAADRALAGNDLEAALALVARGEKCGARGETLGALLLARTEAHSWRGELAACQAAGTAALQLLPRGGPAWLRAASETALSASRLALPDRLRAVAAELRAVADERPMDAPLLRALVRVGLQLFITGLVHEGMLVFEPLARNAELIAEMETRDPLVRGWILVARAGAARESGDLESWTALYEESLEAFDQVGDARTASSQRIDIAFSKIDVGLYEEGERYARAGLADAERLGLHRIGPVARLVVGMAVGGAGRLEEAEESLREGLAGLERLGDRRMNGTARLNLVDVLLRAGRPRDAAAELAAAEPVLAAAPRASSFVLSARAGVALANGRPEEALAFARQAVAWAEEQGPSALARDQARPRLLQAEALHALGRTEEAHAAIAVARSLLLARAAAARDGRVRRAFLERVPVHVRTLALARAWIGETASG